MNSKKLSQKEALQVLSTKLKRVLNPTISTVTISTSTPYIIIQTDCSNTDFIAIVLKAKTSDSKVIDFTGFITKYDTLEYSGNNTGSVAITKLGIDTRDSIKLVLKPDTEDTLEVLAEVYQASDNKNHAIEITSDESDVICVEFSGDTQVNFGFGLKTSEDEIVRIGTLEGYDKQPGIIDTIYKSKESKSLDQVISFTSSDDSDITITGELPAKGTTATLKATVDLSGVVDDVLDELQDNFPVASTEQIGGFKVGSTNSVTNAQSSPVYVKMGGNNQTEGDIYAYIESDDVKNVIGLSVDVHRYSDMSQAPKISGSIVQYIGQNSADYTKGYFYQYTPIDFSAEVQTSNTWIPVAGSLWSDIGPAIAEYNVKVDYLINGTTPYNVLYIKKVLLDNESVFNIVQNDAVISTLTLEEIEENFKLTVNESVPYEDGIIVLTTTDEQWKQKNVQPMLKVGSPLVYQGVITASQGQTDTEALLEQVPNPEIGDCYTVKPSNQEYFYSTEEIWEFMGDVLTLNGKYIVKVGNTEVSRFEANQGSDTNVTFEAGDNVTIVPDAINHKITINAEDTTYSDGNGISISNDTISVEYDNNTIKLDNQNRLYVNGELTDTQADWDETDENSPAFIWNKPNLATVATSGNYSDLRGKPSIPDVHDGVLYVRGNNSNAIKFTANQNGNKFLNIKGGSGIDVQARIGDSGTLDSSDEGEITISVAQDIIPVGTIQMYAGDTAPEGWLLCDGSCVPVTVSGDICTVKTGYEDYQSLVNVITKTFGFAQAGSSTSVTGVTVTGDRVMIPDLQQRFPLGAKSDTWTCGNQSYNTTLGKSGGEKAHTLVESEMPSHNHYITEIYSEEDSATAGSQVTAQSYSGSSNRRCIDTPATDEQSYSKLTVNGSGSTQKSNSEAAFLTLSNSGNNESHNNIPPYVAVNFIIKY